MEIVNFIKEAETSFDTEEITVTEGFELNQAQRLRKNVLYMHSRYLNGNKDSKGRPLPFMNNTKDKHELEVTALNIDTADLAITTDDSEFHRQAYYFSKEHEAWEKEANIGIWLDDMIDTLSQHGGVLVRAVERGSGKDATLEFENLNWMNVICDQSNILDNPIIIKHSFTPNQVRKQNWDKDAIDELIATAEQRERDAVNEDVEEKTLGYKIEVYEVHGQFPRSYLKELKGQEAAEADENDYVGIVAYIGGIQGSEEEGNQAIVAFAEEEDELPFRYLAREPIHGVALGLSIVEENEEPQKWVNYTLQNEWLAMQMAGKQIYQQPKGNGISDSLIDNADTGSVLTYKKMPVQPLSTVPQGMQFFRQLREEMQNNSRSLTGATEGITGEMPPSQTPFRLLALVNQEASKRFIVRKKRIDKFIGGLWRDFVFPFLEKKVSDEHILTMSLSDKELREHDEAVKRYLATQLQVTALLNGEDFDDQAELEKIQKELNRRGTKRTVKIPKGYYEGFEKKLNIDITNERRNKIAYLETLASFMNVVPSPNAKNYLLEKIMGSTGFLSPVEIEEFNRIAQQDMQQMQQQGELELEQPANGQNRVANTG